MYVQCALYNHIRTRKTFVICSVKIHKTCTDIFTKIFLGTKCLSGEERRGAVKGSMLNDSHAEVLARRGFLHWMINQVNVAMVKLRSLRRALVKL